MENDMKTETRKRMNNFHERYRNQIKLLADEMRDEAMPLLTEELFARFETTGTRLQYEAVYFKRRKFLAVFGMAAYIFKRPSDLAKLEEVLNEICREECWALPAHVNRRENENWRNTVDLFAAETAQALAEIVTLVGKNGANLDEEEKGSAKLSIELCDKVRSEIERRVLSPFEQCVQGWECSDHNWNAVCCGSIGSAAMYLLADKEEERLQNILHRIYHSLNFYLDGFREDGACMEGIGYFTYGMTYFTGFAEQLLRYSNGRINLFANDKVRRIAEFQQKMYFSSGQTVSFSDGEARAKFRMGLTSFLAGQYGTVRIPNPAFAADFETDSCYRFMGLMRDFLWTKIDAETLPAEEKTDRDIKVNGARSPLGIARHDVLPNARWSICESENGVGFAIKGGDNGESHNHNDVGSFLYLVAGEQLICDLGAGEYTAEYFGEGRYDILCNSSEGHSVPVVAGEFQKDGAQYRASFFEADGQGMTKIEFAGAYAEGRMDRLTRIAEFSLENGGLRITDSFEFSQKPEQESTTACFTETLVTRGEVMIRSNAIIIQGSKASCLVQPEGRYQNLRYIEKTHFNHEGEQETVRLIQWEVVPEQKREEFHGVSKYIIRYA